MHQKKYDLDKLRRGLRSLAADLVELKKHMRRSGYNPTWSEWERLRSLKLEATKFCCLRAHHRGKQHLRDKDLNLKYAMELEPRFILEVAHQAA